MFDLDGRLVEDREGRKKDNMLRNQESTMNEEGGENARTDEGRRMIGGHVGCRATQGKEDDGRERSLMGRRRRRMTKRDEREDETQTDDGKTE